MYGSLRSPWPAGAKTVRVEIERSEAAATAGGQRMIVELVDAAGLTLATRSAQLVGPGSSTLKLERPVSVKDDQALWLSVRFDPCRTLPLARVPGPGRGTGMRLITVQAE